MTPASLLFLCLLCVSRACIPTVSPDDDDWMEEMETTSTASTSTTTTTETTTTTTALGECPSAMWTLNPDNNFCYYGGMVSDGSDPEAQCAAIELGAHLASIANMAENDFLYNYLRTNYLGNAFYLGGMSPSGMLGTWSWSDLTPYVYEHWDVMNSYPNPNPAYNCMAFPAYGDPGYPDGGDGVWFNESCDNNFFHLLCKIMAS